jgi:hypothetical protein
MPAVINSDIEDKAQDEDFKKYKLSLARIRQRSSRWQQRFTIPYLEF